MRRGRRPNLSIAQKDTGVEKDIDECEDEGNEEGIADGIRRLEERSRVVEDEVDTRPLLHHLERRSQNGATKVALGFP
jgi:hypothetical protein